MSPRNIAKSTNLPIESTLKQYIPASVYRLQFNADFNLKAATKTTPYLQTLGVDAIYASPCFEAKPGSMHGYDVANPNRINPEIGTLKDYIKYCNSLKRQGMGQILDVVPNHMGGEW